MELQCLSCLYTDKSKEMQVWAPSDQGIRFPSSWMRALTVILSSKHGQNHITLTYFARSLLHGKPELAGIEECPDSAGHMQPHVCLLVLDRLRLLSCWAQDTAGITAIVGVQRLQVKRGRSYWIWAYPMLRNSCFSYGSRAILQIWT